MMINGKSPLDYAREACDMMMNRWAPEELPPKGQFHYHQGVFLSGMEKTWELCGDDKYITYIKTWVDSILSPIGNITKFNPGQLDDLQPGILLFPLLKLTGDERYKRALDTVAYFMSVTPKCENGGFWHKAWYHRQMWLDGLYMAGPFLAQYGSEYNRPDLINEDVYQAKTMKAMTEDKETGLWYHAWHEDRLVDWANPETGRSPEFWGRSIGWVPVALLDELDFIPADMKEQRETLGTIAVDLLKALPKYQDQETGLWYQVVDKGGVEGNWLETSCTCLYAAGMMKAVRLGLLDKCYLDIAWKAYEGVINRLKYNENGVVIDGVCVGTGVGDWAHYIARPTSANDLHGVGAYLIMCVEAAQV